MRLDDLRQSELPRPQGRQDLLLGAGPEHDRALAVLDVDDARNLLGHRRLLIEARLTPTWAASSRSGGSRSPGCRSASSMCSQSISTSCSYRRDLSTGRKELADEDRRVVMCPSRLSRDIDIGLAVLGG